jgi:hypothetical protein
VKVDLAAAAAKESEPAGSSRATWTGGKIEIDEEKFLDLIVRAIANVMGQNIYQGQRPDGSGPMPAREYDGKPRGTGARIARALAPVKTGRLSWFIAAHREKIGHLARLMAGVPFRSPPIERIRDAVRAAFDSAVRLTEGRAAAKALPKAARGLAGAAARDARRSARAGVAALKAAHIADLGKVGDIGVTWRSSLAKRIQSAARKHHRARIGR